MSMNGEIRGGKVMGVRLMTMAQIREKFPVSRQYVYRLISEGRFPRQRHIGARSFWHADEVDKALEKLLGEGSDEDSCQHAGEETATI